MRVVSTSGTMMHSNESPVTTIKITPSSRMASKLVRLGSRRFLSIDVAKSPTRSIWKKKGRSSVGGEMSSGYSA